MTELTSGPVTRAWKARGWPDGFRFAERATPALRVHSPPLLSELPPASHPLGLRLEIAGAGTHELHNDHLGSPRVITAGTTGAVEGRQVFGPYGEKLPDFTGGYQPITGYTGHVQQDPSGLIYMRGRFFAPAWHRFINSDQGVDPSTFNQMAYVGGGPMQATDPSGMERVIITGGDGHIWSCDVDTGVCVDTTPSATVGVTGSDPGPVPFWDGPSNTTQGPATPIPGRNLGIGNSKTSGSKDPNCVNGLKPLVLKNAKDKVGTAICGTGNCVTFFKSNMGNYPTGTWVKGPAPNGSTPIGTWVATFYANGRTKFASESGLSHVGAWDGFYSKGIQLVDQYRFPKIPEIQNSPIPWGGTKNFNNNASNYFTILVPCK